MKYPRKWRERCKEKKDSKLVDSVCKKLDRDVSDQFFRVTTSSATITTTTFTTLPLYQIPLYFLPNSSILISNAESAKLTYTYNNVSRRTKRRIRIESKNAKRNIKAYK